VPPNLATNQKRFFSLLLSIIYSTSIYYLGDRKFLPVAGAAAIRVKPKIAHKFIKINKNPKPLKLADESERFPSTRLLRGKGGAKVYFQCYRVA